MENLLPSNDMLGLNIVCNNDKGNEASTAMEKMRKPKKNNKYEKRRNKARQAKLLKEKGSANNTNKKNHKEESNKQENLEQNQNEIVTSNNDDASIREENNIQMIQQSQHEKEDNSVSNAPTQSRIHQPLMSFDNTSTRKTQQMRTEQLLKDEVKRAEYMATYHARPSEMDRKNNAVSRIKQSSESTHIFENDEDPMTNNLNNLDEELNCPFSRCGLHPNIVRALTTSKGNGLHLEKPTIIQRNAWEQILIKKSAKDNDKKRKRNLFIQSETGSGKTLAYLLPIVQQLAIDMNSFEPKKVDRQLGGTRAIILCPTRELATQTATIAEKVCQNSFSWLVPGCLSGGEKRKSEKARLRKGITILVATPGRLLDHLGKTDSLSMALKGKLEWVVLDESDRLLDLGLGSQVEQIMQMIRANQSKSGVKRDGVTWQSILVSATINEKVEKMSSTLLGGDVWVWARFNKKKAKNRDVQYETDENTNGLELSDATPKQLIQHHMVVSSKLRLTALISFLVSRIQKKERILVFMSTCDGVDFHHKLFTRMQPIVQWDKAREDIKDFESSKGIFGNFCSFYRLHGNIPHQERGKIMSQFSDISESNKKGAVMITTDVAARGLNLPSVDWIVQYDPPCETNDYIHRAGRAARAGKAGHALLFLLPSEIQYVEVLKIRGLSSLTALSLSSTLQAAANICPDITTEGLEKSGNTKANPSRMGEAFTSAVQLRLEECIIDDDKAYKESLSKKALPHGNMSEMKALKRKQKKEAKNAIGPLLEAATNAFSAYIRGYSTKEKCVRHIFSARALHLGHVAKSFALREQPKELLKNQRFNNHSKQWNDDTREELKSTGRKRSSQLAFGKVKSDMIKQKNEKGNKSTKYSFEVGNFESNKGEVMASFAESKHKRQSAEKIKSSMLAAASRMEGGDMEFF